MRLCKKCGNEKPDAEFTPLPAGGMFKQCDRCRHLAYLRNHKGGDEEEYNATSMEWLRRPII